MSAAQPVSQPLGQLSQRAPAQPPSQRQWPAQPPPGTFRGMHAEEHPSQRGLGTKSCPRRGPQRISTPHAQRPVQGSSLLKAAVWDRGRHARTGGCRRLDSVICRDRTEDRADGCQELLSPVLDPKCPFEASDYGPVPQVKLRCEQGAAGVSEAGVWAVVHCAGEGAKTHWI